MATEWYYRVKGVTHGPVGASKLKQLADAGELLPTDTVWKEGLGDWVQASGVRGLFNKSAIDREGPVAPPPSPTPPPSTESPAIVDHKVASSVASEKGTTISVAMCPQRLAVTIAATVGGLATFMPWARLPVVGDVDGTVGDGWVTLCLFAAACVAAILGDRLRPLDGWALIAAIVPPLAASGIGIWKVFAFRQIIAEMVEKADDNPIAQAMLGAAALAMRTRFGLYVLIAAGLATAAAALTLSPQRLLAGGKSVLPQNDAAGRWSSGLIESIRSGRPVAQSLNSLPMHIQRIAALLFALSGAAATFLPWLKAVDGDAPVRSTTAGQMQIDQLMTVRSVNVKYVEEMARHMGKKAEVLGEVQNSRGTNLSGPLTFVLLGLAATLSIYGRPKRALSGWLYWAVLISPLIAAAIGLREVILTGSRDKAVRVAVQEFASNNAGFEQIPRLSKPVLMTDYGVWVMISAAVATFAASSLLGKVPTSNEPG